MTGVQAARNSTCDPSTPPPPDGLHLINRSESTIQGFLAKPVVTSEGVRPVPIASPAGNYFPGSTPGDWEASGNAGPGD